MIFPSPHPDVAIPDAPLHRFVLEGAARRGEKPALVDAPSGRALTYGQLDAGVRRVAAGLARRGLGKGDVLAILSPNLPEYALAFFGVAAAGGASTTLNPLMTAGEVAGQLGDSGARLLVTVPPLLDRAREAARGTSVEEVLVFGAAEGTTPFGSLLAGGEASDGEWPSPELDPTRDLVALPYSSGTTGRPKGVMLTHRNLVANVVQYAAVDPVAADETLIAVLPFFHIYGMVVVMSVGLRSGATLVTLPRFEFEEFLRALESHRVTRANLVPPIIVGLTKDPRVERYDLSRLAVIGSGAAPLGEETERACADRLGCEIRQGYGLTETSPVTHVNPPGAGRHGTVGPSLPNTEVRIVDPAGGEPLGVGRDGEVWIRGPQVMRGYLGRPDATREVLDAEGWLRTGDIGRVDADGYLSIVDRLKELIKYKAYQVAPAELEEVLLGHPAVADAAVVPAPDEEAGEVPVAYVVPKGEVTGEAIRAWVAERVAPYKKVRRVEFIDAIPKSASGKILRRVLVERERAGA